MLSFLSPVFLAGAAAAAIPIVLHLLKREPETRVQFAAVKLLRKAPVEHTQRRHLRELILLALRIVALVVLALDTSYSMSAPGRFERAKQLARDAVARAPAGDLVGVVTFDDAAQIVMR